MILEIILISFIFLAVALVAGNNLSACVGPAVGARILTKRTGALLGAGGFTAGLLVQGAGMANSVNEFIPSASIEFQIELLAVAIVIFIIAHVARLPLSFSMSLVGLLAGYALAIGSTAQIPFMAKTVAMWVIAPIVAMIIAYYLIRYINSRPVKDIWRRIRFYKALLLVLAFSTAYVSGANTLGLIVATAGFSGATLAAAVSAIFVGSIFLGEGTIRRVSGEFYRMRYSNATVALAASSIIVEAAALLNIPLSNTQTTTAAVFGAGISYKAKFLSLRPYLIIFLGWIMAPVLSFCIGYLLFQL
ncbi:inorganic phosphate transporter [Candidatus Bathycorpusculum sp.]|uniref:inorganic phosphate transporter n=1 Tax=Candidatus Bathycorpusculum sp. TaxID=2994959 RepID=UPI002839E0EF|nr:inorganic phosphate transporter [Candidatus Termitimicrobium sp.]MCL2431843.1 inorganic phosphate transporter [Candidatus Termitimicrobium sp.]